jgi:hypothetical protein
MERILAMVEIVKNNDQVQADVRSLLLENAEALEDGIEIVDMDVKLDDDLSIDFLAADAKGKPVLIFLQEKEQNGGLVVRLLLVLDRLKKHRVFLERIYKDQGFDFSAVPRFIVLAPEISDDLALCLDSLKGVKTVACEYSFLGLEERVYFTVKPKKGDKTFRALRVDAAAGAAAPPPPAAEPAEPEEGKAEPEPEPEESRSPDEYYQIALEKIKKISSGMVETQDGNLTRFKIDDRILASLAVQGDVCYVFLGEKKDKAIPITSEKILNDTLNQVYKLYATQFGPAKTT